MYPGRTTALLVQGIIDSGDDDLEPYISAANELVTEKCAVTFPDGVIYSDVRLELIERWLSAHFYTNFSPRSADEWAGDVRQVLQGVVDLGLNSSLYGQNAMRLDTQGALAIMNNAANKFAKPPSALYAGTATGIAYLGTKPRRRCGPWNCR